MLYYFNTGIGFGEKLKSMHSTSAILIFCMLFIAFDRMVQDKIYGFGTVTPASGCDGTI
jgi:hypothetical protein